MVDRVNDLISKWTEDAACTHNEGETVGILGCKHDLYHISRDAWRPIGKMPTEEDGDVPQCGEVLVMFEDGIVSMEDWDDVASQLYDGMRYWARVRDVVLMPGGK